MNVKILVFVLGALAAVADSQPIDGQNMVPGVFIPVELLKDLQEKADRANGQISQVGNQPDVDNKNSEQNLKEVLDSALKINQAKSTDENLNLQPVAAAQQIMPSNPQLVLANQQPVLANQQPMLANQQPLLNQQQITQLPNQQSYQISQLNQPGLLGSQQTGLSNQQPIMSDQRTGLPNQQLMSQQPALSNQQSILLNQQPGLLNQQSVLMNQQPGLMNQQPGLINQQPGLMNQQPGLINQQPGLMNQQPGLINQQPGLLNQRQLIYLNQPPSLVNQQQQPLFVNQQPNQAVVLQNGQIAEMGSLNGQPTFFTLNPGPKTVNLSPVQSPASTLYAMIPINGQNNIPNQGFNGNSYIRS